MALEIPVLQGVTAFEQRMQLDGEYYTLTLRWNDRAARWYLDLGDGDGKALAYGVALVTGVPLTAHLRARTGMPPGVFVCLDTSDAGADPGFTDLGSKAVLIYLEKADTVEAEAS